VRRELLPQRRWFRLGSFMKKRKEYATTAETRAGTAAA